MPPKDHSFYNSSDNKDEDEDGDGEDPDSSSSSLWSKSVGHQRRRRRSSGISSIGSNVAAPGLDFASSPIFGRQHEQHILNSHLRHLIQAFQHQQFIENNNATRHANNITSSTRKPSNTTHINIRKNNKIISLTKPKTASALPSIIPPPPRFQRATTTTAQPNSPKLIFIHGASGMGKSFLVQQTFQSNHNNPDYLFLSLAFQKRPTSNLALLEPIESLCLHLQQIKQQSQHQQLQPRHLDKLQRMEQQLKLRFHPSSSSQQNQSQNTSKVVQARITSLQPTPYSRRKRTKRRRSDKKMRSLPPQGISSSPTHVSSSLMPPQPIPEEASVHSNVSSSSHAGNSSEISVGSTSSRVRYRRRDVQANSQLWNHLPALRRFLKDPTQQSDPSSSSLTFMPLPTLREQTSLTLAVSALQQLQNDIQDFLSIVSTHYKPIVFLLDDLQWADKPSFAILDNLLQSSHIQTKSNDTVDLPSSKKQYNNHNMLIVGTYRYTTTDPPSTQRTNLEQQTSSSAVSSLASSALLSTLRSLAADSLELGPLDKEALTTLLQSKLSRNDVDDLAQLVLDKTQGHPIFLIQFLQDLDQQGFFTLDLLSVPQQWTYDIDKIQRQTKVCDNVVDLLLKKFQTSLSPVAQHVLNVAAYIGSKFLVEMVEVVVSQHYHHPIKEIHRALRRAEKDGFISNLNRDSGSNGDELSHRNYIFSHDRIQEAAYRLIPDQTDSQRDALGMRQRRHLEIGRLLWKNQPNSGADNHSLSRERRRSMVWMLAIAEQLNHGSDFIAGPERLHLVDLNHQVAQIAYHGGAFLNAAIYCQKGLDLLRAISGGGENSNKHWELYPDRTLALQSLLAEMEYCLGNHVKTRRHVDSILTHAKKVDDKVRTFVIKMESFAAEGKINEAMDVGLDVLKQIGFHFPKSTIPATVQALWEYASVRYHLNKQKKQHRRKNKAKEQQEGSNQPHQSAEFGAKDETTDAVILGLPELSSTQTISALKIMTLMGGYAYTAQKQSLLLLFILREMKILLTQGVSKYGADAMVSYGILMGQTTNFREAHQMGKLALHLMDRYYEQFHDHESKILLGVHFFLQHLQRPVHESIEPLLRAHQVGMSLGDIRNASLSFFTYMCCYAMCGLPLQPVIEDADSFVHEISIYGQNHTLVLTQIVYQAMLNLVGRPFSLDDDEEEDESGTMVAASYNPLILSGDAMCEEIVMKEALEHKSTEIIQAIHLQKLTLATYFDKLGEIKEYAGKCWKEFEGITGSTFMTGVTYFILGFTAIGLVQDSLLSGSRGKQKHKRMARKYMKRLKKWTEQGEPNVHHMLLVLNAEISFMNFLQRRRRGGSRQNNERPSIQMDKVKKAYDHAISVSRRTGFVQNAALASERAAKYFFTINDEDYGRDYLTRAFDLYLDWGAGGKLHSLAHEYDFFDDTQNNDDSRGGLLQTSSGTRRYGVARFDVGRSRDYRRAQSKSALLVEE